MLGFLIRINGKYDANPGWCRMQIKGFQHFQYGSTFGLGRITNDNNVEEI